MKKEEKKPKKDVAPQPEPLKPEGLKTTKVPPIRLVAPNGPSETPEEESSCAPKAKRSRVEYLDSNAKTSRIEALMSRLGQAKWSAGFAAGLKERAEIVKIGEGSHLSEQVKKANGAGKFVILEAD